MLSRLGLSNKSRLCMNIFKLRLAQVSVLIFTCCAMGSGIWSFAMEKDADKPLILDFDEIRDAKDLINLFNHEAHWLASDSYSPEFMLQYKAPSNDTRYMGKLHIDVCRVNDVFVGFNSYYMRSPELGQLFITAVKPEFRGRKYAENLTRHALEQMKKMGAKSVQVYTRPNNIPSQGGLKHGGFYEIERGDNWVLYNYDL